MLAVLATITSTVGKEKGKVKRVQNRSKGFNAGCVPLLLLLLLCVW